MKCPKCGTTNDVHAKFCGSCGFNLSVAHNQNQNENENKQGEVKHSTHNVQHDVMSEQTTSMVSHNNVNHNHQHNMNNGHQHNVNHDHQHNTNNGHQHNVNHDHQHNMNNGHQHNVNHNHQHNTNNSYQHNVNHNHQHNVNDNNNNHNTSHHMVNSNQNINPKKVGGKKVIFIILAVVIAAVALVFIALNLIPNEAKEEKQKVDAMFNSEQLIRVKSGDKYGYIDTTGKFVLKAIYEQASDFTGDYAIVRGEVEVDGLKKYVYQIIDKKGNVKQQSENSVEYIEEHQLWVIDDALYNNALKKISPSNVRVEYQEDGYFLWVNSKENTGGIMNIKGKQTYTYKFGEGETYISIDISNINDTLKERYCRVNIGNDKYAIVNCDTGTVIQDFTENYISVDSNNIFEIKNKDTYDLISIMYIQNDKVLYQSNSDSISLYYYPGYVQIRDSSKSYSERYSYLHTATGEIKSEIPSSSSEDVAEVLDEWEELTKNKKFSCSTGYGLMNDEQITLPCEWDSLKYLEVNLYKFLKDNGKEYVYGEKDNKWYLIDLKTKKAIIEFNASYITPEDGTTYMYYTDKDSSSKKVYNLLSGKSLNIQSSSTYLTVYSNYITVKDNTTKTLKYYNTDLELIYTENL